jgi:hypothetical protein
MLISNYGTQYFVLYDTNYPAININLCRTILVTIKENVMFRPGQVLFNPRVIDFLN